MIFCKLLARTHSIEFQKRGYPHVHIIVWVDMDCVRHLDPEIIDKIVCAKIPNEYKKQQNNDKDQPRTKNPFHKAVTSFMLHGPHNHGMACMKNEYCQCGYRKEYSHETMMSEDGYPIYRRRSPEEGGNSFSRTTQKMKACMSHTNDDVVSCNKYLLYKYNCHVNVEYCHSVMAIKHHLKYNRGSDEAIITVEGKTTTKILSVWGETIILVWVKD